MKLSRPAQQAKIEFLKKHNCAKKIQRSFRGYLFRQAELERELEEEAQRQREHKAHMAFLSATAIHIQRAFRAYLCRKSVSQAFMKRQRLRMIVTDLVTAWKTRRSLNCLGSEV